MSGHPTLGGSVTEFSNSGAVLSGSNGYTNGNMYGSYSIAIDGSGDAWVPNYTNIAELRTLDP